MEEKKIKILESLSVIMMILAIPNSLIELIFAGLTFRGLHKRNLMLLKIMLIPNLLEAIIFSIAFIGVITTVIYYFINKNNKDTIINFNYASMVIVVLQFCIQIYMTIELYKLLKNPLVFLTFGNSNAEVVYTNNTNNDIDDANILPSYSPPNPLPPYSPPATNNNFNSWQPTREQISPYPPTDDASIIITPTRLEPYPPPVTSNLSTDNINISTTNPNTTYSNIPNLTNLNEPTSVNTLSSISISIPMPENSLNIQNNSYLDMSSNIQYTSSTNLLNNMESHQNIPTADITDSINNNNSNENILNNTQNNSTDNNTNEINNQPSPPPYTLFPTNNR